MSTPVISNNNYTVTQSPTTATTSTATSTDSNSVAAQQDTFLKLLVTQMQNQDPLNPMDNSQMTSQIAQLNTVQGINQLNATVSNLQSQLQASQNLQATNFIGKTVLAPGSNLSIASNGKAQMGINLDSAADTVMIQVKNGAGNVVRTYGAGSGQAGLNQISWDGKNDSGQAVDPSQKYTFAVKASSNGSAVPATALSYGAVNSISMSSTGVKLNTDSLGSVDVNSVQLVQ
jgi:flagellar basal-body rod modification protein FlgD